MAGGAPKRGELTLRCASCGTSGQPLVRAQGADQKLELACRFCGTRSALPVGVEAASFQAGQGCPKCGAPRADKACPRCGLIYEKWQGRPEVAIAATADTEEMWRALKKSFFEPPRHQAFLAHCLHSGALQYAATRYAEEEESSDPDRASIAEVRRRQVRALAEATFLGPSGDAVESRKSAAATRKVTLLTGTLALVVLCIWMGYVASKRPAPDAARATEPAVQVLPPMPVSIPSPSASPSPPPPPAPSPPASPSPASPAPAKAAR